MPNQTRVVIVGGGFAGMSTAHKLVQQRGIHVTLIDKNNYHQFTPLLYQVATSAISIDNVATTFRSYFEGKSNIDIKMAKVCSIDPKTLTVHTEEGESYQGDVLVLAAGSVVNFFDTTGAMENSFPLYNLNDAERLRSRIILAFEEADRNPKLIDEGVLNFVVVGAGPTGTEIAGALADMINISLPKEYADLALTKAKIYLVDYSHAVLSAFSEESQKYAAETLHKRGVQLRLGLLVRSVTDRYALLSSGEKIASKTIIWAGGLQAAQLAQECGLVQGHGGRIEVQPDLTIKGFPSIYALGDFANMPGRLPQLASVAQQSGYWTADNIIATKKGKPRKAFQYKDKGIMAMIGRNAAVVEVGKKRRELTGFFAFLTWLSVHSVLLSTLRQRIEALMQWSCGYFSKNNDFQTIDRIKDAHIIWKK
ncbi:MAG: NAD(P)/FAD-dependent oxidoreductase [Verrucomicrobia bacterium]|nr:NAD(P)/FAD-dependent oxidoreductase [Verrucomicrobiota bacterium]